MVVTIKYLISRFFQYANKIENISNFKLFIMYGLDYLRHGCTIKDFFVYKFYFLNNNGKKLFSTGKYLNKMFTSINKPDYAQFMISKEESLLKYNKHISRDWCGVKYNNSLEEYKSFVKKHTHCIVKPLSLFGGHGIRIIDLSKYQPEELHKSCITNNEIIEELIVQHKEMSRLHSKSINTIRIVTEEGRILGAVLRVGSGGSSVDNACSGGMFAQVDVEHGIVVSKACNYNGDIFLKHPDTGVVFPGFEIPMWGECIRLVEEAVAVIPQIPITGFDLAVTPNGPTLVEVNESPDLAILQQTRTISLDRKLLKKY